MINDWFKQSQFYIEEYSSEVSILVFFVVMALIVIIYMLIKRMNGRK